MRVRERVDAGGLARADDDERAAAVRRRAPWRRPSSHFGGMPSALARFDAAAATSAEGDAVSSRARRRARSA